MKLVLIHGRDQQGQDPDVLQSDWLAALDRGLQECHLPRPSGLQVEFPFFGDKLAELIRKLEEPILHDVLTRGPGKIDSSITALQAEMLQEMADSPASTISDSDVKAQLQGDVQTRDAQNWGWVIALAKALDTAGLGGPTIDLVTHDVAVYLENFGVRKQVDAIVQKAFTGGPYVVVAHSLGSVVAYHVLRSVDAISDVRLFVTVGSPLGLKAVRTRLDLVPPCEMPGCIPTKMWFNARDPKDIVAAYPLDAGHFNIDPAITNHSDVNNHTPNHHSIGGYLDDPEVARAIHGALV
ncbi:MAG: hypothetical protein WBE37_24415 [Bryobacteraceae bacterium]